MTEAAFSRRGVILAVGVLSISFISYLIWSVFGDEIKSIRSSQADSFSRSAIGHHAFVQLLEELEVPTVVSRYGSGGRASDRALLVLAEPLVAYDDENETRLRQLIGAAEHCLVVLPKWDGTESMKDETIVERVVIRPAEEVEQVFDALKEPVDVVRMPRQANLRWTGAGDAFAPKLIAPQLIRGPTVTPLIRCAEGTLLGRVSTAFGPFYVLSDPDLISNHGLAHPTNATAILRILERVQNGADRTVLIDETLHGYGRELSFWRALFDVPLLYATLHVLAVLAVVLWAAMGRFGRPVPVPRPLGEGREVLLDNTAALLAAGGYAGSALSRYMDAAVAETGRALHAPARLQGAERDAWLDRIATSRDIRPSLQSLRDRVREFATTTRVRDGRTVTMTAQTIHRWKEEMIRGRKRNS